MRTLTFFLRLVVLGDNTYSIAFRFHGYYIADFPPRRDIGDINVRRDTCGKESFRRYSERPVSIVWNGMYPPKSIMVEIVPPWRISRRFVWCFSIWSWDITRPGAILSVYDAIGSGQALMIFMFPRTLASSPPAWTNDSQTYGASQKRHPFVWGCRRTCFPTPYTARC